MPPLLSALPHCLISFSCSPSLIRHRRTRWITPPETTARSPSLPISSHSFFHHLLLEVTASATSAPLQVSKFRPNLLASGDREAWLGLNSDISGEHLPPSLVEEKQMHASRNQTCVSPDDLGEVYVREMVKKLMTNTVKAGESELPGILDKGIELETSSIFIDTSTQRSKCSQRNPSRKAIRAQSSMVATPSVNQATPDGKKTLRKGSVIITRASSRLGLATPRRSLRLANGTSSWLAGTF